MLDEGKVVPLIRVNMIRPNTYKLLALIVAQTFAATIHAAPVPSGVLDTTTNSQGLALKSATTIGTVSNNDSSNGISSATGDAPYSISLSSPGAQPKVATENETLTLKLDSVLKMAAVSQYGKTPGAEFTLVTGDSLVETSASHAFDAGYQPSNNLLSVSAGGSSASSANNLGDNLAPLGRAQRQSSGLEAATNLTVADLMGYLDQFASDELAAGTLRAPLIVAGNQTATNSESMLFLRPDSINADVPEPGTLVLIASSLLALYTVRRRRQR